MGVAKYEFRPLARWTDPETAQRRSSTRFKVDPDAALLQVRDEVSAIGGALLVVEVVTEPDQIRLDGILRANAKIGHPGVVVSFDSEKGPLRFACDTFTQAWSSALPGWAANLRAIGLTLEALRAVDRYGAASSNQQYTGWAQIEAGPSAGLTYERALAILFDEAGFESDDPDGLAHVIKRAKINSHPDANGGDRTAWDLVERAARVVEATL